MSFAHVIYHILLSAGLASESDLLTDIGLHPLDNFIDGIITLLPDFFALMFNILYLWSYSKYEAAQSKQKSRFSKSAVRYHGVAHIYALLLFTSITNPSVLHLPYLLITLCAVYAHARHAGTFTEHEDIMVRILLPYTGLHLFLLYIPAFPFLFNGYESNIWGLSDWTDFDNVLNISYLAHLLLYVVCSFRVHFNILLAERQKKDIEARIKFEESMKTANLSKEEELELQNQLKESPVSSSRRMIGTLFRLGGHGLSVLALLFSAMTTPSIPNLVLIILFCMGVTADRNAFLKLSHVVMVFCTINLSVIYICQIPTVLNVDDNDPLMIALGLQFSKSVSLFTVNSEFWRRTLMLSAEYIPALILSGYYYLFKLIKSDLVFSNLRAAVISHDNHFIQFCLKEAPHLFRIRDKKGRSVLHIAVKHGQLKLVCFLLSLKNEGNPIIDPNLQDKKGYTALHLAFRSRFFDIVEVLEKCTNKSLKSRKGDTYENIGHYSSCAHRFYATFRVGFLFVYNFALRYAKYLSLWCIFAIAFGSADYISLGFLVLCMYFLIYPGNSDKYWSLLVGYSGLVVVCTLGYAVIEPLLTNEDMIEILEEQIGFMPWSETGVFYPWMLLYLTGFLLSALQQVVFDKHRSVQTQHITITNTEKQEFEQSQPICLSMIACEILVCLACYSCQILNALWRNDVTIFSGFSLLFVILSALTFGFAEDMRAWTIRLTTIFVFINAGCLFLEFSYQFTLVHNLFNETFSENFLTDLGLKYIAPENSSLQLVRALYTSILAFISSMVQQQFLRSHQRHIEKHKQIWNQVRSPSSQALDFEYTALHEAYKDHPAREWNEVYGDASFMQLVPIGIRVLCEFLYSFSGIGFLTVLWYLVTSELSVINGLCACFGILFAIFKCPYAAFLPVTIVLGLALMTRYIFQLSSVHNIFNDQVAQWIGFVVFSSDQDVGLKSLSAGIGRDLLYLGLLTLVRLVLRFCVPLRLSEKNKKKRDKNQAKSKPAKPEANSLTEALLNDSDPSDDFNESEDMLAESAQYEPPIHHKTSEHDLGNQEAEKLLSELVTPLSGWGRIGLFALIALQDMVSRFLVFYTVTITHYGIELSMAGLLIASTSRGSIDSVACVMFIAIPYVLWGREFIQHYWHGIVIFTGTMCLFQYLSLLNESLTVLSIPESFPIKPIVWDLGAKHKKFWLLGNFLVSDILIDFCAFSICALQLRKDRLNSSDSMKSSDYSISRVFVDLEKTKKSKEDKIRGGPRDFQSIFWDTLSSISESSNNTCEINLDSFPIEGSPRWVARQEIEEKRRVSSIAREAEDNDLDSKDVELIGLESSNSDLNSAVSIMSQKAIEERKRITHNASRFYKQIRFYALLSFLDIGSICTIALISSFTPSLINAGYLLAAFVLLFTDDADELPDDWKADDTKNNTQKVQNESKQTSKNNILLDRYEKLKQLASLRSHLPTWQALRMWNLFCLLLLVAFQWPFFSQDATLDSKFSPSFERVIGLGN